MATTYEDHPLRGTVSRRSKNALRPETSPLHPYLADPYHITSNPTGIVGLSVALNSLTNDILEERLRRPDMSFVHHHLQYFPYSGVKELKTALARFITDYFKAANPLDPQHIVISSGVQGGIDLIAHTLGDPGDTILVPAPNHGSLFSILEERGEIDVMKILLTSNTEDKDTKPWQLTAEKVEHAIIEGKREKKTIKALFLTNPTNPFGIVFSEECLLEILLVCQRYDLHVVLDEIFGLSVWKEGTKFTSVLELKNLPDPMRTHFLWGLSKDFSLPGFRVGMIYSRNPVLMKALHGVAKYCSVPYAIQCAAAVILQDREWLDTIFFPERRSRTLEAYHYACQHLTNLGVPFLPPQAGLFIWADFRKFLPKASKEEELALYDEMLNKEKVGLLSGSWLHCMEPGWFRIVFTVPKHELDQGMQRIQKVLTRRKNLEVQ